MRAVRLSTPYDFRLSPESGWTRNHWMEMFADLIVPIIDNGSPGSARQVIPGPRSHHGQLADELEGFTRSFIMAGPWLHQAQSPVVSAPDGERDVAAFYRRGILHGTDPDHPEYWGQITDYAQHLVEMASLAWSLYLSRRWIWDTLSAAEQKQVAAYLFQCTGVAYHQNNWLLFNVVTNAVLKRLDMPYSQQQIDQNIDACEHMYVGSGWYRDGAINRIDYYNAWAFHYYYLIWTILDGDTKSTVAARHRERASELAVQLPFFVSGDGSAPVFGRSMIYRFGYIASLVLGAYLGALEMPVGLVRSVCNRTMRFFADQPIVTDQGFLGMGFVLPNESMLEHYSCGGSPYWAAKAFNALLIPSDAPFWTAREEPLPIRSSDYVAPLKDAGLVLVGSRDDGHVQIVNQKSYHDKPEYNAKYTNFVYSSLFPYESRPIHGSIAPDNALQFSADGIRFEQRWEIEHIAMSDRHSASRYRLFEADPNGEALTTIVIYAGVLVLIHHIVPTRPLWYREGGFPLGYDDRVPTLAGLGAPDRLGSDDTDWTAVCHDGRCSLVANLFGYDAVVPARPHGLDGQGTNVRFAHSLIPQLQLKRADAKPFTLAALIAGSGGSLRPQQVRAAVSAYDHTADEVTIAYADRSHVRVQPSTGRVRWD